MLLNRMYLLFGDTRYRSFVAGTIHQIERLMGLFYKNSE